jgi:hypothetical protein
VSISTFQEKIFKSGCGVAVLIFSAAAMGVGMVMGQCNRGNAMQDRGQTEGGPIAVQIGEVKIPAADVERQAQQMLAMSGPSGADLKTTARTIAQVIDQQIQTAAAEAWAREVGADTSDEAIRKFVDAQVEKIITEARQQYIDTKKLKPNSTQKEFDELFKKERGQTPEDFRKSAKANIEQSLSDPAAKQALIGQIAPQLASEKLKATMNPSEAEVKAKYNTLTLKRVFVSSASKPAAEVDKQIQKAVAELKAGAKIEDVMNRYSNDLPPGKDKKVSDVVTTLSAGELEFQPQLEPLMKLQSGEVSEVIEMPGGKAVYKLISVKNTAPADFAKNFQKYKDEFVTGKVMQEMRKKVEGISKSDAVKLPLPGYKALYDYSKASTDMQLMMSPDAFTKRMRELADAAKTASTDADPSDDNAAMLAWYSAVDDLWTRKPSDTTLREERVEAIQAVLQQSESFKARMDLADMAIEMKNADLALQAMLDAARMNNSYDATGDQQFRDIQSRLGKMKSSKLITNEQAAPIEAEQARWRKEKAENEKAEKEMKSQQSAEKKSADLKSFDDADKKMAEQVKKEMEKNQKK